MTPWDDAPWYSADPPEHRPARCPYGHQDASSLGYCQDEAQRMVDGLRAQRLEKLEAGDMVVG